jgi:[acyl-carrier-protein] S-malonyltransferase
VKVAFCFPGQGSQAAGMGRELASAFPEARSVYDEASAAAGFDVAEACFEGSIEELTRTDLQQPTLVATCLACLRTIETTGLKPDYVIGHSVGEYAALAAARSLGVGDAVGLVRERGLAMAETARANPGAMAAVIGLDDAIVEELCGTIDGVWPANYNCPGQIVVSGLHEAVDLLLQEASARGARRVVKLLVSGAFHSPLVQSAANDLRPAIEAVDWREPVTPFMSTVTAELEPAASLVGVLIDQLTAPVRFTQAIRSLVERGVDTFVEVGPGQVLGGLIKRCDRSATILSVGDPEGQAKLDTALAAVRT